MLDPSRDPKWEGISGDMAKEFGEASPVHARLPAAHMFTAEVKTVQPPVIPVQVPVISPVQVEQMPVFPSIEEALSKKNIATNGGTNDEIPPETFTKQIEALQSLLKHEHDQRKTAEAIAKELTVENRCLRDEIVKASAAAAGAKAALEAREELLQHLKEDVAEMRAIVFKRNNEN